MASPESDVVLQIGEPGSDDEYLDQLARQLREELLQLPEVESVEPLTSGEAPEGTRSALAMVAGSLVAGLANGKIQAVIGIVMDWLRRSGSDRSVRLEVDGDVLELHGVSDETQAKLVDDWLSRRASG